MAVSGRCGSSRSLFLGACALSLRIAFASVVFFSLALTFTGLLGSPDGTPRAAGLVNRRLKNAASSIQSTMPGAVPEPANEASGAAAASDRVVADLRLRGLHHRLLRVASDDADLLQDDRDVASVHIKLSAAAVVAQRQQYERATHIFRQATTMAKDFLKAVQQSDDAGGQAKLEDAQHVLGKAYFRSSKFYLERGMLASAEKAIAKAAPVFAGRSDTPAISSVGGQCAARFWRRCNCRSRL